MDWELIFWNALYTSINASAAAYCLIAVGLNVHVGYTGLLNFGQAGFAAVGAYAFAIPIVEYDWPWYAALPRRVRRLDRPRRCSSASRRCACAPTTWRSSPSPRPRSSATSSTRRGSRGSPAAPTASRAGPASSRTSTRGSTTTAISSVPRSFDGYRLFMMVLGWSLVAVLALLVWALMRSPWGRVLKSIREDEDAARALGKNVVAFKMQSLMLGGLIGSIGGLMLAAQTQSATPGQFATNLTFFAFTIIILGGLGRVKGPIIGTIIFFFVIQFVDNVLSQATRNDKLPDWLVDTSNFSQVKFIVAGARPRRCSSSSVRRASSATAGSRCSMSADPRRPRSAACPDAPAGRRQVRSDPGRRQRAPSVRRPRRRRRRPRRGPAQRDHRAHRSERRRQDDVLQPADRLRRRRTRAVVVRRSRRRRPCTAQARPARHGADVPADQEPGPPVA